VPLSRDGNLLAVGDGRWTMTVWETRTGNYVKLCSPAQGPSSTVQLLIHGATYGSIYWDFPYQPQTYSYVDAMTRAGYSTFTCDRIGVGHSSHPPSKEITIPSDAFVAHQLVQDLLAGRIGQSRYKFARVVIVGHSVGTMIAAVEAATYHDIAGAVFSGQLQRDSQVGNDEVASTLYPANQDPRFKELQLDSGYITTRPGTRTQDFYYVPTSDPQVREMDENTKEVASIYEINTFDVFFNGISKQIDVPVLDVIGQKDSMGCAPDGTDCSSSATVQKAEAPYFSPAAHLKAIVIPDTGHDLNLQITAPQWYDVVIDWMGQHFGS
jgi:pimeloyl-ACP methyl ester carboxylesterase